MIYYHFVHIYSVYSPNKYGDLGNGRISVQNYGTIGSPTGAANIIHGNAYVPNDDKPGELKVKFDNMTNVANYWIIGLGTHYIDYCIIIFFNCYNI